MVVYITKTKTELVNDTVQWDLMNERQTHKKRAMLSNVEPCRLESSVGTYIPQQA